MIQVEDPLDIFTTDGLSKSHTGLLLLESKVVCLACVPDHSLTGKLALIARGFKGIGKATSLRSVGDGDNVVTSHASDESAVEKIAKEI